MAKQRKATRAQRQQQLTSAARRVTVPAKTDVVVIGGGASGLVAAIVAARAGARVVVLERDLECGRTILATGNGRCNFANAQLDPNLYNDPAFVGEVCGDDWLNQVLRFFRSCGLAWVQEAEGRLYPLSRQAASVRAVLLHQTHVSGAVLAPAREVTNVLHSSDRVEVQYCELWNGGQNRSIHARSVIVAVGGGGLVCCEGMGIDTEHPMPVLCPLACTHPTVNLCALDGRRVRARTRLLRDGQLVMQESGEVLLRAYGVSGIAVFNLSRHACQGDVLELNLAPSLTTDEAQELARTTLDGILDPHLASEFLRVAGTNSAAIDLAKAFRLDVTGTTETTHAQVTRGGLIVSQFFPTTLEARSATGVFACGEALNVDGPCGGFNLAWAWKSGMLAGAAAANRAKGGIA